MTALPPPEPDAAYQPSGPHQFRASALTRGPWHPEHQHAGPPIALVCRAVERMAAEHGLNQLSRLTANLFRPVPIGELTVEVMTDYAGRNAGHFSAHLLAGGKEVARFTALVQRATPVSLPEGLPGHPLPQAPLPPEAGEPHVFPFGTGTLSYAQLVQTRIARGVPWQGPSAVWFRLAWPLVAGEAPSPAQRVAVAADSGNGISGVLDFRAYSFANADLTINLLRPPVGEWVCVDARTALSAEGGGLAESALYDVHGLIGRATQSLAVRRLR